MIDLVAKRGMFYLLSALVMIPGLVSVLLLGLYLRVPRGVSLHGRRLSLAAAFRGAHRSMALLFSIAVIREFTRLAVVTFLPIFLAMQGQSLAAGGVTLALFSLSGALGGMLGGSLSDAWGRRAVILVSGVLCVPLLHGIFLTDDALAEFILHLEQALGFLLGKLHEGHPRPHGDDFGDILRGNNGAAGAVPAGAQAFDAFAEFCLAFLPFHYILVVALLLRERAVLTSLS